MNTQGIRPLLLMMAVVFSCSCVAQDEYPDYRNRKESFSKIQEKDIRKDLASFAMGGIDESIGKLPLRKIPATSYGTNSITFQGDNLKVTITTGVFDASKHKLAMMEKHLAKIDGKGYFGNYGVIPRTTIQFVGVVMGKDSVIIPPAAYADLYNPSFTYRDASGVTRSNNAVYFSPDSKRIYIYLLNRDDTGGYEVTWVIDDKKYLRRVVDYGFLK